VGRNAKGMRYLPFPQWPQVDNAAWSDAIAQGDILDGRGPAAHWSPAYRHTSRIHYSRWLAYLADCGIALDGSLPEDRLTREATEGYVEQLRARVAPRTMVSAMVGLKVMMKAMAPHRDWRWLGDVCNALNRNARPTRDKLARMRPSDEIYAAALGALDDLGAPPFRHRRQRVAWRDSLMLALMAARPLRIKNFAGLTLGRSFVRTGQGWLIAVPGEEIKNGMPLEYNVPTSLVPYLEIYLQEIRPAFLLGAEHNALWLTFAGKPMAMQTIHCCIIQTTTALLGVPINPHLLRDCAATMLSSLSPEAALATSALLGHRSFATTERYYIRANQLDAGRKVSAVLLALKKEPE
jgi:integrase/recombinase XerD